MECSVRFMGNTLQIRIEPEFFLNQLGLGFIEDYNRGSNLVYHAEKKDGQELIVKVPLSRINPVNFFQFGRNLEQMRSEILALDVSRDVCGITRKLGVEKVNLPEDSIFQDEDLFDKQIPVLIKQYVPGKTLADGGRIVGKTNQDFMEGTLGRLYDRGISLVDNISSGIVVTPNGKPVVVDMGFASFGKNDFARKYNLDRALKIVRGYYDDN